MDLYSIHIPKSVLDAAPDDERMLHLMAGQLVNDMNILVKLAFFAMNPISGHEVLQRAQNTAALLFLKLLAGKVSEGRWLIRRFSPLYPKYETDLDETAKEHLEELKGYFGRRNLVTTIRDMAGFHSDAEIIRKGYAAFPSTEVFVDYHSGQRGNNLYYGSEIISMMGVARLIHEDDWKVGLDKIADEIPKIATKMTDFLVAYMEAFVLKYVGDISAEGSKIEDGPPLDGVTIPFFCVPPLTRR